MIRDVVFKPVLRPVVRLVCGLVAIPLFRLVTRKVFRVHTTNVEMERDLENWFRGSVIMLAATANLEEFLLGWNPWYQRQDEAHTIVWQTLLLRLMLAVGVIESMPDEDVFSIVHRGPPKLKLTTLAGWREFWRRKGEVLKGLGVLHLRRSSPVLLIMAVILGPPMVPRHIGWWCYGLAITQYLIIALITQRDRLTGLMEAFDRETATVRTEILMRGGGASAVVTEGEAGDPNLRFSGVCPSRYD